MSARTSTFRLASFAAGSVLAISACSGPRPREPIAAEPVLVTHAPAVVTPVSPADSPATAPSADDSPWQRVRERFVLSGCDYSDGVVKQARRLTAAPERFSSTWAQAMPLLQIVVAEVERRKLPGELALLPYVESRYQALRGKTGGPAGMWQLMAPTARSHGLRISTHYDGRLDPFESTRAALDLIERFDREFGDWRLASMAYNAGEYRLKRALRGRTATAMTPESLARLEVSPITHQFLERVLALSCIVQDPARFKVDLPTFASAEALGELVLDSPVDFTLAARLADVTIDDLRRYNAGWISGNFLDSPQPRLILPKRASDKFTAALSTIPTQKRAHWKAIRLDENTPLTMLAQMFDIPEQALATANGLEGRTALDAGQLILVPGCDPVSCPPPESETHAIRSGDTLSAIARRYGVRVAELLQWNALRKETILHTGMQLRIRAPGY